MPKETRINIRVSKTLKERIQRGCELTGLPETTLVSESVEAAVRYIENHGGIWLPLAVVPANETERKNVPTAISAPADVAGSTDLRRQVTYRASAHNVTVVAEEPPKPHSRR